ncbi:MAG: flippase-like domain-containing protein, partial [Phycisphaerae bacterium]|nr:flippase-like domain-containing protein [Phycisphaerae bacterium]
MDNDKKLFEGLLKADGIDPAGITDTERENFRVMLDSEKKKLNALNWRVVGLFGVFAAAMVGVCFFSDSIESKLGIPIVVTFLIAVSSCMVMFLIFGPGYYRKSYESGKKVDRLNYLVHGKHRRFAYLFVGKENGRRVIKWPRLIMLTMVLWLLTSLIAPGIFYLLFQYWLYSKDAVLNIVCNLFFPLAFVITMLITGLKAPLDELTEIKDKPKPPKPGLRRDVWVMVMQSRITRFSIATIIIIAVLIGINKSGVSIDGSSVAWADVVKKFRSMSSYSAVVYAKKDASSEPIQVELWVSNEQKARLRVDSQVLFAEKGEITACFNFKEKKLLNKDEYNEIGRDYITFICKHKSFSLDNLVQLVQRGNLVETTPKINSAAIISEDLLVFDLDTSIGNEWMRIWALRESRLPVRFRSWNPDNGGSMDVFVNYEKQQPDDFFDHQKYEKLLTQADLKSKKEKANLAYAFLKDPGGKNYVPEHTFKNSQYHMPIVDDIGVTKYGAVWLVTSKSENRRKDGRRFNGFSSVSDNLNRHYRSKYGRHSSMDGTSVNLYVSPDYPFDQRAAESFKLTCSFPRKDGEAATDYVGSVEITEWKQSGELPQEIKDKENELLIQAGYDFSKAKKFEKVNR